jgi:anti-sigma factor RsiW
MNCDDIRPEILDYQRGRLSTRVHAHVRAHLDECPACRHEVAAEAQLTDVLEHRFRQQMAPLALKRRLAAQWPPSPGQKPSWWAQWGRAAVPSLVTAAAALLVLVPNYYERTGPSSPSGGVTGMVDEAVTDHLRILGSQHPLDVESGDMHHVRPWYEGRLDFAPAVGFLGDREFPLAGGSVGYFLDRKAAIFVFHRGMHAISLFVFPARALPWPTHGLDTVGPVKAYRSDDRGFHVILWRKGEQGCALVSDVDSPELTRIAARLSAAP